MGKAELVTMDMVRDQMQMEKLWCINNFKMSGFIVMEEIINNAHKL